MADTPATILFVGDVVGGLGRRTLLALLPRLRAEHAPTFVVVNGENAAGGLGITPKIADELFAAGVDVITLGNHTYHRREIHPYLDATEHILRPANYLAAQPGHGHTVVERDGVRLGVVNLSGNVFLQAGRPAFTEADVVLGKLEGNNPAGSVKDRPAISMIKRAEERGEIRSGDTLIEATSGNTGIALAMAAAIRGYHMVLIMPEDLSIERAQTMRAFGAELVLTPRSGGMEYARDLAEQMQRDGKGRVLDQFANADNPRVHFETTGPEIWADTAGRVTHFVSAMGTTGTITGVSRYLKSQSEAVRIIGVQPAEGSRIAGIRKWPEAYLPRIYDPTSVDELMLVSQADAEDMARRMACEEGLFAGISAAGACWVAVHLAQTLENATIVFIVCDRGDRYLSTGVFPA